MSTPEEPKRPETEAEVQRRFDVEVQRALDQADPHEFPAINELLRSFPDFKWTPRRLNRYTRRVRMKVEDILRPGGIKEVYTKDLIPDDVLIELNNPQSNKKLERDGMLNTFDVAPQAVSKKATPEELMSVQERMISKLEESKHWLHELAERSAKGDKTVPMKDGVYPEIYEGAILRPIGKSQILSWMTWSRSLQSDPSKRTRDNDAVTQEVDRVLNMIHYFDDFKRTHRKIFEEVLLHRIAFIDTVQSVTPGAATVLMNRLMKNRTGHSWKNVYDFGMGYRHSELEFLQKKDQSSANFSRGGNKQSGKFWYDRDFRDMGTHQSNVAAVRGVNKEILVRPTERWMFGILKDVSRESAEIAKKALKRFN